MAASGVVTVAGTVAGIVATPASDTITVRDRNWSWRGTALAVNETQGSYDCDSLARHFDSPPPPMGHTGGTECGNQTYIFTPMWNGGAGSVAQFDSIRDGPNTTLWYTTAISARLIMHSQVLKDIRSDGHAYSFTSATDSATSLACANSGVIGPANLWTINLTCYQNSNYSAFFDRTWLHEQCHQRAAIAEFDSLPDADSLGERVVRRGSLDDVLTDVLYQANGIYFANLSVINASAALDDPSLPTMTYSLRWYQPGTSAGSWPLTQVRAWNYLAPGC